MKMNTETPGNGSPGLRRRVSIGFTAIELLVVVSIIAIVSLLGLPALIQALRKDAVNRGGDLLLRTASQAQTLAKLAKPPSDLINGPHYGVALIEQAGRYRVQLIKGSATAAGGYEVLQDNPLSRQVRVWWCDPAVSASGTPAIPLAGRDLIWFYQYGSGRPITAPPWQNPVSIGTPEQAARGQDAASGVFYMAALPYVGCSPVASHLSVRAADDRYRLSVSIYAVGLGSWIVQ